MLQSTVKFLKPLDNIGNIWVLYAILETEEASQFAYYFTNYELKLKIEEN